MKKVLSIILVVLMLLSMVACGNNNQPANNQTEQTNNTQNENTQKQDGDVLTTAANAYFAEFPGNRITNWEDVFALIDAGDAPYILSIRQAKDYDTEHIKGAFNAAWGEDLSAKIAMLPKDKPVYLYCYTGQTAGQAVAIMNMLGIEAYSLKGGINNGAKKIEGYEKYIETTKNELVDAKAEFDKSILEFAQKYFIDVVNNANFMMASPEVDAFASTGDIKVVDIRQAQDFEAAHIEGAVNIPFGKGMQEKFVDLPKDKKLVVACYTGQTAGQAVAILRALGYDALSLQSGMTGGYAPYVVKKEAAKYFAEYPGNRMISWEDLLAKIDAGENPYILSIRQQKDYDAGHVKGAVLAAWGDDLAAKISMLPTDKPVYVYCYTGQTAGQAVALMNMMGIEAYSVTSGFVNGLSKIEGYEKYVDTVAVEMTNAGATFNPYIKTYVENYFKAIATGGNNIIELDQILPLVESGKATVIDIRKAEDFALGHVKGAINIPFGKGMQESFNSDVLPKGKLIVACYSGQTAGQATAILKAMGFDAVSMKAGMKNGWEANNLPVVTD